jgi:hypothetical protein
MYPCWSTRVQQRSLQTATPKTAPKQQLLLRRRPRCRTPTTTAAAFTAAAPWPAAPTKRCHRVVACSSSGGGMDGMPAAVQGMVAELRADPALAPLLDDPRVAAAVREVAQDPGALRRYAGDRKVGGGRVGVLSTMEDRRLG